MIEENLIKKIKETLNPDVFYIENESHMHSGPRTESHFKLYIVDSCFEGLGRVDRQRFINDLVKEEFEKGLHALSLRLRTKKEHEKTGVGDFISPLCVSKKENL